MAFLVFHTPSPASAKEPDGKSLVPSEVESMGAAIDSACKLKHAGTVVWRIKGSNGFVMERSDIEIECDRRMMGEPLDH